MRRTGIRVLVVATTVLAAFAAVAPAGAADTVSGRRLESIITDKAWPTIQARYGAGTPIVDVELTKAHCPKRVSSAQGTRFTCTAVIDGQPARFDGRIDQGRAVFSLRNPLLFPDLVEAFTEQAYEQQRGSAGSAICSDRTIIVGPPPPGPRRSGGVLHCTVTGPSGTTSTATLTFDKTLDITDVTFAP